MKRGKPSVLLVSVPDSLAAGWLAAEGCELSHERAPSAVSSRLASGLYDALVIELTGARDLPELRQLAERWPDLPILACGDEEVGHEALAAGACDFVCLPATEQAWGHALRAALARCNVDESPHVSPHLGLLGCSPQIAAVRERVLRVASGAATVLVRGETGTGKELVARALHGGSARSAGPFVRVHASALPDALLESELFGYEKGAFTGAAMRKPGRVELADGGTLFFDEIGELSLAMQVKLLRLIQEREYERLGGTRTLRADVRFVAATHRDLEDMVTRGTFREDLFYRLNVVTVWLPPLRARRDDVALLAQHYLEVFRAESDKPSLSFDEAARRLLTAQRWPGNVRQLVNFVERLVVLARGSTIDVDDVRRHLDEQAEFATQAASTAREPAVVSEAPQSPPALPEHPAAGPSAELHFSSAIRPLKEDVRRAERRALLKALQYAKGNRALAARMLGVSRRTLYTKLEEHELD